MIAGLSPLDLVGCMLLVPTFDHRVAFLRAIHCFKLFSLIRDILNQGTWKNNKRCLWMFMVGVVLVQLLGISRSCQPLNRRALLFFMKFFWSQATYCPQSHTQYTHICSIPSTVNTPRKHTSRQTHKKYQNRNITNYYFLPTLPICFFNGRKSRARWWSIGWAFLPRTRLWRTWRRRRMGRSWHVVAVHGSFWV